MRAVLVGLFSIVFTEAFLFGGLGCNVCGGGGYGGYGGGYGGGYSGGSYSPSYSSYSSYSSYAPQASYVQPQVAPHYDTLYAGRPYFTPVGSEGMYSSYSSFSPSMTPTYNQILPLPANAQIVSGYPASPVNPGYSPISQPSYPSGGGYATGPSYPPQVSQPIANPAPQPISPPAPVYEPSAPAREVHDGYIQPAASVQPYTPVRHASVEEAAPVAPVAQKNIYRETVIETPTERPIYKETAVAQQPVEQPVIVKTTYTQPSAPVHRERVEVPITKMINTPEEAGYRH